MAIGRTNERNRDRRGREGVKGKKTIIERKKGIDG
jgi:hypothetical protein